MAAPIERYRMIERIVLGFLCVLLAVALIHSVFGSGGDDYGC